MSGIVCQAVRSLERTSSRLSNNRLVRPFVSRRVKHRVTRNHLYSAYRSGDRRARAGETALQNSIKFCFDRMFRNHRYNLAVSLRGGVSTFTRETVPTGHTPISCLEGVFFSHPILEPGVNERNGHESSRSL